jgi:hypothetical protein
VPDSVRNWRKACFLVSVIGQSASFMTEGMTPIPCYVIYAVTKGPRRRLKDNYILFLIIINVF